MLGHHLLEVAGLRQAQAADAVEMALDALGDLPGDRMAGELAERGVELVVEHARSARGRRARQTSAWRRTSPRSAAMSPASARVRGEPHGGALERLADELRVVDGGRADPRDVGAELGHDLDEALVAQADQRLAHRRAADGEPLGELVLGDPLARGRASCAMIASRSAR